VRGDRGSRGLQHQPATLTRQPHRDGARAGLSGPISQL
jgi:hypothetical protein